MVSVLFIGCKDVISVADNPKKDYPSCPGTVLKSSVLDLYYTGTKLKDYARCIINHTRYCVFISKERNERLFSRKFMGFICPLTRMLPLARTILFFRFFGLVGRDLVRSLLSCLNSRISCIQFQTSFLNFLINLTSSFKESFFDIFTSFC